MIYSSSGFVYEGSLARLCVRSGLTSKHLSRHIIYIWAHWAPHEYFPVCVLPTPGYGDLGSFYLQSISDPLISTPTNHQPVNVNRRAPGYKWFMPGTGTSTQLSALTSEQWSQPPDVPLTSSATRGPSAPALHWRNSVVEPHPHQRHSGQLVQHSSWIFAITYFKVRLQLKLTK